MNIFAIIVIGHGPPITRCAVASGGRVFPASGRRAIKRPLRIGGKRKPRTTEASGASRDRKLGAGMGASFPVHLPKTTPRAGLGSGAVNNSDSLAMLAAMRRASSRVRSLPAAPSGGSLKSAIRRRATAALKMKRPHAWTSACHVSLGARLHRQRARTAPGTLARLPSPFNVVMASSKMAAASLLEMTLLMTRRSRSAPTIATLAYPSSCAPAGSSGITPVMQILQGGSKLAHRPSGAAVPAAWRCWRRSAGPRRGTNLGSWIRIIWEFSPANPRRSPPVAYHFVSPIIRILALNPNHLRVESTPIEQCRIKGGWISLNLIRPPHQARLRVREASVL